MGVKAISDKGQWTSVILFGSPISEPSSYVQIISVSLSGRQSLLHTLNAENISTSLSISCSCGRGSSLTSCNQMDLLPQDFAWETSSFRQMELERVAIRQNVQSRATTAVVQVAAFRVWSWQNQELHLFQQWQQSCLPGPVLQHCLGYCSRPCSYNLVSFV